jgi:cytoskeletal protein CcmA (bactofilin family)
MPLKKTHPVPAVILEESSEFKGKLVFGSSLQINGHYEGLIESPGYLYIDEKATIKADIRVGSLVIGGEVKGDIETKEMIEILSTGRVYGNIKTMKSVKIEDGAVIEGHVEMVKLPGSVDIFSMNISQLKKSIHDEKNFE